MQNDKPLEYRELREEIHVILSDFFNYEYKLQRNNEFDWEFLEYRTDDILQLIKHQGGQV